MLGVVLFKGVKSPNPNSPYLVSSSFIIDHIFAGYGKILAQGPHRKCPVKVILP